MGTMSAIGNSAVGEGAEAAHVTVMIGHLTGPVGTAFATALATPTAGHAPFLACLTPDVSVKPPTLIVNKATHMSDAHAALTWGPAQAGVCEGVLRAVAEGIIDAAKVDELAIVSALWINPAATDADAVFANNSEAVYLAIKAARHQTPVVADLLTQRHQGYNGYYRPAAK